MVDLGDGKVRVNYAKWAAIEGNQFSIKNAERRFGEQGPKLERLVQWMLQEDAEARPTVEELLLDSDIQAWRAENNECAWDAI